jgi:hypothetical protein
MNFTARLKQAVADVIDPRFFNFVAQCAHTATTYGISYTLATKWGWKGYGIGAVSCVLYAAIHEFWYDPKFEDPATRGSDVQDFLFLCLGVGLAALAYWL